MAWNDTDNSSANNVLQINQLSPEVRLFSRTTVYYIFPIIIAIGSVGNGLSFAVLLRKRLRSNSLYFYLRVLTLADTLVLYVSCFKTWLRALTHFELLHVSNFTCKLTMFVLLVGMHLAAWLVVLVTVDRCVSVWLPFRAAVLCTPRRAAVITCLVCLLIVIYNSHVFWTIGLHPSGSAHPKCISSPDIPFMQEPFEYLKLATYSFIPFAVVFALNLAIIYKISQRPSILQEKIVLRAHTGRGDGGSPRAHRSGRQQRVIYMLLTLSFSWLILTAPYAVICVVISAFPDFMSSNTLTATKTAAFILLYLNHSINFYLYCITGQKFREEFMEMICFRKSDVVNVRREKGNTERTTNTHVVFNMKSLGRSSITGASSATYL